MNRKKIETNKIIEIVRVTEPEKYEELFFLDNGQFTPVKILGGAYYRNGRISNFWDFEDLLTGRICNDYGHFYKLYIKESVCTYRKTGCGSCENQENCPYDKESN